MVAYSFASMFVAPILIGTKRQTIRPHRRRHARPGEAVQLYTGMRTKRCRKIVPVDPVCTRVDEIRFDLRALADAPEPQNAMEATLIAQSPTIALLVNGMPISSAEATLLAASDGFDGFRFPETDGLLPPFTAMVFWWMGTHGPVLFDGVMIRWEPAA